MMVKISNHRILAVVLLLNSYMMEVKSDDICRSYGLNVDNPGVSCADIYEKNPTSHDKTGSYLIKTDRLFLAHCDMEFEKGWAQVADLDISRGDTCPKEWKEITVQGVKACRSPSDNGGCYSKYFPVNGTRYRKVRGLVRGYQKGSVDSFSRSLGRGIDQVYVDGVSITLGNPRKHVWTFVAGCSDGGNHPNSNCPCATVPGKSPPSFIGEHYYCESGNTGNFDVNAYYMGDPLWNGAGCSVTNTCCTAVGLPWFYREFPTIQDDDIEVRICADQIYSDEAVLVDQIKLFIQ